MKTTQLIISLLLIGFISFTSCKKKETEDIVEPTKKITESDIIFGTCSFLKVTNKWTYNYDDNVFFTSGKYTVEVVDTKPSNQNIFLVVSQQDSSNKDSAYWFVEGDYIKSFNINSDISSSGPFYKLHPTEGDTWSSKALNSETVFTYTTDSTNENYLISAMGLNIEVNRIRVDFSDSWVPQYNFWNDSLGLVHINNLQKTFELESVILN